MSKQVETLKKELNEMYRTAFENCEKCNYEHCGIHKTSYKDKIKYDYAAHLGEKYGEGKYKVLFVGKEGLKHHEEVDKTQSILNTKPNNKHYLGTIYTLALLNDKKPESMKLNDLKEYENIHKQFCLTNYFKCAFLEENDDTQKVRGLPGNTYMKDHCYEILIKEIEILKPDLVIIQGKFTTKPFWDALDEEHKAKLLYKNAKISLYKYTLKNRTFCVLWSYHPASSDWSGTLQDFIKAIKHQ